MRYQEIFIAQIVEDPDQVRRTFTGIEHLSESIEQHGLIQNLVVKEDGGDEFRLVAGARRVRAIRLLESKGVERKRYMALVLDGDSDDAAFVQLVENEERQAVAPWEIGRRFLELIDAGLTQEEIGARSGCSQVKVSMYSRIAAYLAPAVVARLNRLGPTSLSLSDLKRLASIVKRDGSNDPDEKKQIEVLDRIVSGRSGMRKKIRAPGQPPPDRERIIRRYRALKEGQVRIPEEARFILDPVMAYLDGRTRGIVWPEELS